MRTVSNITRKSATPDSKALPPLLNKHAEKKRLISISKEQDIIKENRKKWENLNKVLNSYK